MALGFRSLTNHRLGRALTVALLPLLVSTTVAASPVDSTETPPDADAGPSREAVAPLTKDRVWVIVAGDIAGCEFGGDDRTADLVATFNNLVMTTGDNVYDSGSPDEYASCYDPTWGRFRGRTRPVPGNHDWRTLGAAGYFDYFGDRAGPPGRGYYAFDHGTWRIYALSSDCGAVGGCGQGSPQFEWLEADLSARPHACVMAIWHHPRFSSGRHGGSVAVRPLLRVLYRAGAEIVLNGHDHTYERFAPARPDGTRDRQRGIRQFIVGTGGAPLYPFTGPRLPHTITRDATSHGVLRLTLRDGGYAWRFLPVEADGYTDRGRGVCH